MVKSLEGKTLECWNEWRAALLIVEVNGCNMVVVVVVVGNKTVIVLECLPQPAAPVRQRPNSSLTSHSHVHFLLV